MVVKRTRKHTGDVLIPSKRGGNRGSISQFDGVYIGRWIQPLEQGDGGVQNRVALGAVARASENLVREDEVGLDALNGRAAGNVL